MDMLKVKNGNIVDSKGNVVHWKGVCVGGWMNMEFFINGYPGAEHSLRAAMKEIIGEDKTRFFFDRM